MLYSESLRLRCSDAVTAWLDAQAAESLYLTAISAAELWTGIAVMPEGARKAALETSLDDLLARLFGARRLDFDHRAARAYAELTRRTTAAGLIAAIALAHGFAVATRDIAPFQAAGVELIDPREYRG